MNRSLDEIENEAEYFRPPSLLSYKITGLMGLLAFIINVFMLTVFFCNSRLMKSSALLISLTFAHALNGAIHSIVGFWPVVFDGTFVTAVFCVWSVWPEVFLALYQLIPFLLALNATERLLALSFPVWYRTNCTSRRLWTLAMIVMTIGLLLIIGNGVKGWLNDGPPISGNCIPNQIFGMAYMVYGVHTLAIIGGAWSILFTAIGVRKGRSRMAALPTNSRSELVRMRKQLRLTKCLLMISVIDVICVVAPNVVLELFNTGKFRFPLRYVIYPVIIYCSDSVWNIAAFLVFNREFRKTAIKLVCCRKATGDSQLFISITSLRMSKIFRRAQNISDEVRPKTH